MYTIGCLERVNVETYMNVHMWIRVWGPSYVHFVEVCFSVVVFFLPFLNIFFVCLGAIRVLTWRVLYCICIMWCCICVILCCVILCCICVMLCCICVVMLCCIYVLLCYTCYVMLCCVVFVLLCSVVFVAVLYCLLCCVYSVCVTQCYVCFCYVCYIVLNYIIICSVVFVLCLLHCIALHHVVLCFFPASLLSFFAPSFVNMPSVCRETINKSSELIRPKRNERQRDTLTESL